MADLGIASVGAIVVICFLIGVGAKMIQGLPNDAIPFIVGVAGLIIGVVAFYLQMPDFPANDPITAAAVGAASGLASTGIKELTKSISNIKNGSTKDTDISE